jgi:hypothetical protein
MQTLPQHVKLGYVLAKAIKTMGFCPPVFFPHELPSFESERDQDETSSDENDGEIMYLVEDKPTFGDMQDYTTNDEESGQRNDSDNDSIAVCSTLQTKEIDHGHSGADIDSVGGGRRCQMGTEGPCPKKIKMLLAGNPIENTNSENTCEKSDELEDDDEKFAFGEVADANDVITSYMLKNSLLWEVHKEGPSVFSTHFEIDTTGAIEWSKRIYKHLYNAVAADKVSQFFVPSLDLLDTRLSDHDKYNQHVRHLKLLNPDAMQDLTYELGDPSPQPRREDSTANPKPFLTIINKLLGNIE